MKTKIEWTDYTFNPWRGCTKISPGCANCYAETMSHRNPAVLGEWGLTAGRVIAPPSYWKEPLKWNRQAETAGVRRRVFCASLADVFEDWDGPIMNHRGNPLLVHDCEPYPEPNRYVAMPAGGPASLTRLEQENIANGMFRPVTMADLRRDLFALIDATPHLNWLILTKRPENIRRMWPVPHNGREPLDPLVYRRDNVWLLTSVEDQETADQRIPELLKCRDLAPVLGLSCEPLLGKINFGYIPCAKRAPEEAGRGDNDWLTLYGNPLEGFKATSYCSGVTDPNWKLDWVIAGGESGPNARPCDVLWIKSLLDQCRAASVPCFVKQLGANSVVGTEDNRQPWRDKKGGDASGWPDELRVREFPTSR